MGNEPKKYKARTFKAQLEKSKKSIPLAVGSIGSDSLNGFIVPGPTTTLTRDPTSKISEVSQISKKNPKSIMVRAQWEESKIKEVGSIDPRRSKEVCVIQRSESFCCDDTNSEWLAT